MTYVDGFVLPIPRDRLEAYKRVAETAAVVWKDHGALDYHEFLGDDMHLEGTRSFTEATGAREGDVVIFGWVTFPSREARDLANKKVPADARMAEVMESADCGFDPSRMIYGGFASFVRSA